MQRIDHFNDPNAPRANTLIPAASAIIANEHGEILLHQRSDNNFWALPGGTMEIGENIRQTVIREAREETGLEVQPQRIVGIYSDPKHVIEYPDGEVRQEFSICFACRIVGGKLRTSDESFAIRFFSPHDLERLNMHESTHIRIQHFLEHSQNPFIG
ncbi:MAG TPA: NUDIX domain-containing protein [Ktedonobacteraceae bacterium]|nr:NUDIX domain-containing protein [Ktedonobacteraceae bacterium]